MPATRMKLRLSGPDAAVLGSHSIQQRQPMGLLLGHSAMVLSLYIPRDILSPSQEPCLLPLSPQYLAQTLMYNKHLLNIC